MSNSKPTSGKADAMAKRLQETLARRRPRSWRRIFVTIGVALVLSLLPAYWIWYPRPPSTLLQIVAFDAIYTPDETPRGQAQLLAPEDEEGTRRLRGETIVFAEPRLPGKTPRENVTSSDAAGQSAVDWPTAAPMTDYLVRYINTTHRHGSNDRGRLFVWPKETPLLIVDADETLVAEELDEQAAVTLTKAQEEGWRIVYLAVDGSSGYAFRKTRDWTENEPKLPKGPVLGRRGYPSQEAAGTVRREILKSLQDRFKGAHAAVVRSADAAAVSRSTGIRTILLGDANPPAEVLPVATWGEVPVRLK